MSDETDPNHPDGSGGWDDSVEKLLDEYKARGLVPEELDEEIKAAIEDGEEARILLKVVKRRRRSRQEGSSEDSD
jgi:hypothetical protein